MLVLNYSDFMDRRDISDLCKKNTVVFDFKLWDIPTTMRRNVKTCAELGGHAVTVADHPLNHDGITEALQAGKKYGIEIIVGSIDRMDRFQGDFIGILSLFWNATRGVHSLQMQYSLIFVYSN